MTRERGDALPSHPGDEFAYAEAFTKFLRRFAPVVAAVLAHNETANHPERWEQAA